MDLDFIDGWGEMKVLGRAVFPLGEGTTLDALLPDETRLLLTTMQDN